MKKIIKKVKRKNPGQVAKGKKRAEEAKRNEKGWFVKTEKQPAQSPAEYPAQNPAKTASLYITTNHLDYIGHKKIGDSMIDDLTAGHTGGKTPQSDCRDFERHVDKAMKDEYWLNLMVKRTGLPLWKRKTEITEIFKGHVIRMGKEEEITSEKKAKAYFNNFARRGTPTHRETREELNRQEQDWKEENPYRYEDANPKTGERSYYGIPIPADAPPRPTAQATWYNAQWEL